MVWLAHRKGNKTFICLILALSQLGLASDEPCRHSPNDRKVDRNTLCLNELNLHYKKKVYNENQLYSMGDSAHCSLVTYMGRKPRKEGTYVCIKLIHVAIQQTLTQHCKATTLQWNTMKFKTRKERKIYGSTLFFWTTAMIHLPKPCCQTHS